VGDMSYVNGFDIEQIERAKNWSLEYEKRGYQPLPSCSTDKKPMIPYAYAWQGGLPSVEEMWRKNPSGNVQVMCGRHWNLCVIDCDGADGLAKFQEMCVERNARVPKTWIVVNERSEGRHLWFSLPPVIRNGPELGKRLLWGIWEPEGGKDGKGGWKKRAAIELLCDRSLAMAPPSIHPVRRKRYSWLGGNSPYEIARPALLPLWLLTLEAKPPVEDMGTAVPILRPLRKVAPLDKLPCTATDVKEAIQRGGGFEKQAVDWGLKIVAKRANTEGWKRCYDLGKDDHPSASFNPTTGRFRSFKNGNERSICFFLLGVELAGYRDWYDCCVDMGRKYLPEVFKGAKNAS
jgi:hypothetical protein